MLFHWLRERRRQKILERPFPDGWRELMRSGVDHVRGLGDEETIRLEQLVQVFVEEKNFEGCGGLLLTDEIRVSIATQACILILGLPHDLFRKVDSILVYPTTVYSPRDHYAGVYSGGEVVLARSVPVLGEAHLGGPIILVWDDVQKGAHHPQSGHNVVFHEFAHKLDMLDGEADGAPPLHGEEQYETYAEVCGREFESLRRAAASGRKTFLDQYGATNPAEFFAVATEYFFDKPAAMKRGHLELYEVLKGFYNQDPAARVVS